MTTFTVTLEGCRPEPLLSYLKALGVLRLVAEQKDPAAAGCWRNDRFVLRSTLDMDALVTFFAEEYQPTPIFAPWNGGAGFIDETGEALEMIAQLSRTEGERFNLLKHGLETVQALDVIQALKTTRDTKKNLEKHKKRLEGRKKQVKRLTAEEETELKSVTEQFKRADQETKALKDSLLVEHHNHLPDELLHWQDVCGIFTEDGYAAAPVLGSGGNDGRMEFSANYLRNVFRVVRDADETTRTDLFRYALLADTSVILSSSSIGQFAPGAGGGANATQGMEGDSFINPCDYLLMLEGVLLLQGSVAKRCTAGARQRASFPFTMNLSSVGYGTAVDDEAGRGELWMPLWGQSATVTELKQLFAEARAQVGDRPASSGLDFVRAMASFGVDRGIDAFARYSLLVRNGLNCIAAPTGRIAVREAHQADLLREVDHWLSVYRFSLSGAAEKPRLTRALRRIDAAMFAYCQYGGPARFVEVLCALGQAEREIALKRDVRPLHSLSPAWIGAADDASPEFELALSLAGLYDQQGKLGPLRCNLESVNTFGNGWTDGDRQVVWGGGGLCRNLVAVLQRRVMDGLRKGCADLPLDPRRTASLDAVAAFIAGEVDDRRIEELLWGFCLIKHKDAYPDGLSRFTAQAGPSLPAAYRLLKLLFLGKAFTLDGEKHAITPEPQTLQLLTAGRIDEACVIAARRLRASGLTALPHPMGGYPSRDGAWCEARVDDPLRVAAALLFPLSTDDTARMAKPVLRPRADASTDSDQQPAT